MTDLSIYNQIFPIGIWTAAWKTTHLLTLAFYSPKASIF